MYKMKRSNLKRTLKSKKKSSKKSKSVPKRNHSRQESILTGSGKSMNEKAFNFIKNN